jgi:hypothetical protein
MLAKIHRDSKWFFCYVEYLRIIMVIFHIQNLSVKIIRQTSLTKVYEDNALGKLPDARYLKLSAQYEQEQQ